MYEAPFMKRNRTKPLVVLAAVCAGIAAATWLGIQIHGQPLSSSASFSDQGSSIFSALLENAGSPLNKLLWQLFIIVASTKLAGRLFQAIGQPSVVGEMFAGILLGPSFFGQIFPEVGKLIFAPDSLDVLMTLSNLGVCLFMFMVGMELDLGHVRKHAGAAGMISIGSMAFPFFLGVMLTVLFYPALRHQVSGHGGEFFSLALFLGVAMSVTAFPVLARIIQEKGLAGSILGNTAITCAAVGDVMAWTLLAIIVAVIQSSGAASIALNLVLTAGFVVFMFTFVKPLLQRVLHRAQQQKRGDGKGSLAVVLCLVIVSASVTEMIGIHAIFGAFLAGMIVPDIGDFRHKLTLRIEDFTSVLLLPFFFAYAGLQTQIGLLSGWQDWLLCILIILLAMAGKIGGTAAIARMTGMDWRHALQLGSLMNARGLMELLVLNVGYQMGVLSQRVFTMMVIMAVVTTIMTGPLLSWFGSKKIKPAPDGQ